MRTNTVIDDQLINQAQAVTGGETKHEAVEQGLEALITLQKQRKLRSLRGKLQWEGDLNAMRRDA